MADYREEFPDFGRTVYLDCAYQGPFPKSALTRLAQAIELKCHPERLGASEYFDLPDRVRERLARVVGARPEEIALTNSATQGLGLVASGFEFQPGDEVVIATSNFPSNLFTWLHLRRRGVEVRVIRPADAVVRPGEVAAALSSKTRVVALDWVGFTHGLRIDLRAIGELAHQQGSLFVVDGSQGVGALELNLRDLPIDLLAAAAYKWLLGPYGTGFVYVPHRVADRLDLPVVNWLSVEGSDDFDALPETEFKLVRAARVFDVPETANFLNLYALEGSLEFVERAGVRSVSEHCGRLVSRLADGLARQGYSTIRPAEPERNPTILGFHAGSLAATQEVHRKLRANHVAVSLRHGIVRVSPYLYNTEADIDRLLEVVGRNP